VDAGVLTGEDLTSGLEAASHVGRWAVLAHQIHANRVVCDLGIASEAVAEEVLGHMLQALAPVPVFLCLRNRPEDGPEAMEQLLRLAGADADRLGLALDPGAAYRAGWDVVSHWERLIPLIQHVYATDAIGRTATTLGAGEVLWEELAERLREGGYSGAVTLWQVPGATAGDSLFAEAELKEARFLLESWFIGA
jgi:sugar phosphate isomerase/epimerase